MISHKHKFIFIHIPKCGGTSVEQTLLKNEGIPEERILEWILHTMNNRNFVYGTNMVMLAFSIVKLINIKLKTKRNISHLHSSEISWERFLSEYFYIKKVDGCNCEDFDKKYSTFKHFVINNGIKCCYYAHDFPQIDFVFNSNHGKLTNFVGRCEDMQYDFDYICGKLKIPKTKLPNRNPTKHKHYTKYYDDETKQIVAEKYAKDIEYFGYEFGK